MCIYIYICFVSLLLVLLLYKHFASRRLPQLLRALGVEVAEGGVEGVAVLGLLVKVMSYHVHVYYIIGLY